MRREINDLASLSRRLRRSGRTGYRERLQVERRIFRTMRGLARRFLDRDLSGLSEFEQHKWSDEHDASREDVLHCLREGFRLRALLSKLASADPYTVLGAGPLYDPFNYAAITNQLSEAIDAWCDLVLALGRDLTD